MTKNLHDPVEAASVDLPPEPMTPEQQRHAEQRRLEREHADKPRREAEARKAAADAEAERQAEVVRAKERARVEAERDAATLRELAKLEAEESRLKHELASVQRWIREKAATIGPSGAKRWRVVGGREVRGSAVVNLSRRNGGGIFFSLPIGKVVDERFHGGREGIMELRDHCGVQLEPVGGET